MVHRKLTGRIPLYALLLAALACPAFSLQVTKQLAPGVSLVQDIDTNRGSALIVNVVSVDLANPAVSLKAAIGEDVVYVKDPVEGREAISSLTARTGALIGVNADFFPFTGDPLGTCIINGELISEPGSNRATLAIRGDHTAFFDTPRSEASLTLTNGISRQIDGINRARETLLVVDISGLCLPSTTSLASLFSPAIAAGDAAAAQTALKTKTKANSTQIVLYHLLEPINTPP
jgi:hypothetical protein